MTTTTAVGQQPSIEPAALTNPPAGTASNAGLDVATSVMAIRAAARRDRIEDGVAEARASERDRGAQMEARLEAMRRAAEARNEGGLWSDIAGIAKTVALVLAVAVGAAATIYTAGTSGVLAAAAVAALTAAPAALPRLATAVADATDADQGWRLALQGVALAACVALAIWNPAGAISGASQTASTASETARTVARAADTVDTIGRLAKAQAQISGGFAELERGLSAIREGDAQADGLQHRAAAIAAGKRRDEAMDQIEDVYREASRATRAFTQMIENQNQGAQAALRA